MKIANKKAFLNYQLYDHFEAGIALLGSEVKAIRLGHADLNSAYVKLITGQAYLVNAKIFPYEYSRPEKYEENRTRKLLLHKKELLAIKVKADGQKLTIVPISLYTRGDLIKLELSLGKGKKEYQKRRATQAQDLERDLATGLEEYGY